MSATYKQASARIGSKIRTARESAGLTQQRLADSIRTSRRNVLRWEGGYNMPRAEHIAAIADATGQSTDYFLNGDDEDEESDLYASLANVMREVARHEAEKVFAATSREPQS